MPNIKSAKKRVKVIKTKIYTSIHHFSPIVAINDCNDILKYIQKDKILRKRKEDP